MRAGLRVGIALAAAWLGLGGTTALAQTVPQSSPPATSTAPATDTVGPRDLQNFSLGGTVTRRADPAAPPASTPAPRAATQAPRAATQGVTSSAPERTLPPPQRPVRTERAEAATAAPLQPSTPASPTSLAPPPAPPRQPAPAPSMSLSQAAPSLAPSTEPSSTASLAAQPKLALWPWLLAAMALGGGGAFLLWRKRREEAFAGGPQSHSFAAPEPAARPVPRPAPKPVPAPPTATPAPRPVPAAAPASAPVPTAPPGIPGTVTTRLRPTIEMVVNPLRFIVEDSRVALELELELVNSGNAPARAVLVEATLLNAGNQQDEQLQRFFENPVGEGQRIVAIPPLQRVMLKTQVSVGREQVQQFEIADKKVCVPLLALNALYRSNSNECQTSVAYLIGRDTDGGKLAPFRLDLGPRLFRGVGLRQLPNTLRK